MTARSPWLFGATIVLACSIWGSQRRGPVGRHGLPASKRKPGHRGMSWRARPHQDHRRSGRPLLAGRPQPGRHRRWRPAAPEGAAARGPGRLARRLFRRHSTGHRRRQRNEMGGGRGRRQDIGLRGRRAGSPCKVRHRGPASCSVPAKASTWSAAPIRWRSSAGARRVPPRCWRGSANEGFCDPAGSPRAGRPGSGRTLGCRRSAGRTSTAACRCWTGWKRR